MGICFEARSANRMFVTRFLILFFVFLTHANAWGPACEPSVPRFSSVPSPRFEVSVAEDGAYEFRIDNERDGLKLDTMVLTIYMEDLTHFEEIEVPLRFYVEDRVAIASISVQKNVPALRYEVRARYSESACGPLISFDFSLEELLESSEFSETNL